MTSGMGAGMDEGHVLDALAALGIEYRITRHAPMYTIEEMDAAGIGDHGLVCKNLFLRDSKGRSFYLIVLRKDKKADLNSLQEQIGCTRMGFASEEKLMRFLGLEKGAVTPLGIINDVGGSVAVCLDRDLIGQPCLGVHPNVNTATVWLSHGDLVRFIEAHGHAVRYIDAAEVPDR